MDIDLELLELWKIWTQEIINNEEEIEDRQERMRRRQRLYIEYSKEGTLIPAMDSPMSLMFAAFCEGAEMILMQQKRKTH